MTTLRQAAQQALEALERYQVKRQDFDRFADAITDLRKALEQPEQQPVATMKMLHTYGHPTPPAAQREPLTEEMRKQMLEASDNYEIRGAFANGWLSAEAAHGIKEPKP
jgi:hypothetical protein